ncbi:MAG: succinyldiaminopimelate transaminase [Candidatus Obscuribacterales bacterium]
MNSRLDLLQPYPFEKLAGLLEGVHPPAGVSPIRWSIGEPAHAPPAFVLETIKNSLPDLGLYPLTKGLPELSEAIAAWLTRRFSLKESEIDPSRCILPVSGTREALFSIAQAVIDSQAGSAILMPNPFYQIYEGAALIAGARTIFYNLTEDNNFEPDFSAIEPAVWKDVRMLYVCSPSNPTGHCLSMTAWKDILALSQKYDFIIASDECYSELYRDEENPPVGLLQAASTLGVADFKNCLVFHSLSKRSNLPGMRSGFVAGDPEILSRYWLYRTYHGCTMSVPYQKASIAAWQDEEHVKENRRLYRLKFEAVIKELEPELDNHLENLRHPDGSFYLWAKVQGSDEKFTRELYRQENLLVLPGSYLSRMDNGSNPGAGYLRMALVAPVEQCAEGARRLHRFLKNS